MRRSLALTAAFAIVTSMLVAVPETPASARTNSLTIVTLNRQGDPLTTTALVTNTATGHDTYLSTNRAHALPAGTYVVLVDIYGAPDYSDTLGAKQVRVAGPSRVTFRSRLGEPVRPRLRPALTGYTHRFLWSLLYRPTFTEMDGYTDGAKLYVLPSAMRKLTFAFSVTWQPRSDVGDRYLAVAQYRHGLPNGVHRIVHRSTLATVGMAARRGVETGDAILELAGQAASSAVDSVLRISSYLRLPGSVTYHVPAGHWRLSEDMGGDRDYLSSGLRRFRAGHHYQLRINRAVWGPTSGLPYRWTGGRFYAAYTNMFSDPVLDSEGPRFRTQITLTHNGRTVLSRTGGGTVNPIIRDAGWYTLTKSAERRAHFSGVLSPRSELKVHYYDDLTNYQQVRGYITQFLPSGLDRDNRAAAGSHTRVTLRLRRDNTAEGGVRQQPDAVRKVVAWWSRNGGSRWHEVTVTHRNGSWAIVVPNPASGAISLRATVFDTHGSWTRTTVIDGYAVGGPVSS